MSTEILYRSGTISRAVAGQGRGGGEWQSPLQLQAVPMAFHYVNIEPIGPIMSGSTVVHPMISYIQVFQYREFEPVA